MRIDIPVIKKWTSLKDEMPEEGRLVYFLWTDDYMKDHCESGYMMRRANGELVCRYTFPGMIEPTHWWYPDIQLPPYPEIEKEVQCV